MLIDCPHNGRLICESTTRNCPNCGWYGPEAERRRDLIDRGRFAVDKDGLKRLNVKKKRGKKNAD